MRTYKDYIWSFTSLFIIIGLMFFLVSFSFFYLEIMSYKKLHELKSGETILNSKIDKFNDLILHSQKTLEAIKNNTFYNKQIQSNLKKDKEKVLFKFTTFTKLDKKINQLRFINTDGHEIIRVERKEEGGKIFVIENEKLQDKSSRYYFQESMKLKKGEFYVSKIDLNKENGVIEKPVKPITRVATPIFEGEKKLGILIINLFMKDFLIEMTNSEMFYTYVYDNYLIYSNDKNYENWSEYADIKVDFSDKDIFLKKEVNPSIMQGVYIGLSSKVSFTNFIKFSKKSLIFLLALIIPLALIIAYLLAKIPKRLINKIHLHQDMLLQQSKFAVNSEIISSLSHQWRQPLNTVNVLAQEIEQKIQLQILNQEEAEKLIKEILMYIDYMNTTIEDFRNYLRPSSHKKTSFNVVDSIESVLKLIGSQFEKSSIEFKITMNAPRDELVIVSHKNEFKQAIINIIYNAKDAIEQKSTSETFQGVITIDLEKNDTDFIIRIVDNGGGIDNSIKQDLFEPYSSTKDEQNGTGLGLYISKIIIKEHMHGEIRAENCKDGAAIIITLKGESCQ